MIALDSSDCVAIVLLKEQNESGHISSKVRGLVIGNVYNPIYVWNIQFQDLIYEIR